LLIEISWVKLGFEEKKWKTYTRVRRFVAQGKRGESVNGSLLGSVRFLEGDFAGLRALALRL